MKHHVFAIPGASCSKLTTSLVNDSLKFQINIINTCTLLFFVDKMRDSRILSTKNNCICLCSRHLLNKLRS